jgi:hypothetical protein
MRLQTGPLLPLPPPPLVTHVLLLAQADIATLGALLGFGGACGTAGGAVQGCSASAASQSGTSPAMLMRLQTVTNQQGS